GQAVLRSREQQYWRVNVLSEQLHTGRRPWEARIALIVRRLPRCKLRLSRRNEELALAHGDDKPRYGLLRSARIPLCAADRLVAYSFKPTVSLRRNSCRRSIERDGIAAADSEVTNAELAEELWLVEV